LVIDAPEEHRAHAYVTVYGCIGNEGKVPAYQAPGERRTARDKQSEKPQAVALPIEHAGEQCPKQNVGNDVQIGGEEVRFQAAALKKRSADADQQAVENGILAIRRVLMSHPAREDKASDSTKRLSKR